MAQMIRVGRRYGWLMRLAPASGLLPIPVSRWLQLAGSDKEVSGGHRYGLVYDELLKPMKWRRSVLVEIGIGGYEDWAGGESLAAWRSYLPFATIIGCDFVDKRYLRRKSVDIEVLDQGDNDQLEELARTRGPFDVVIDDGSHLSAHQISTFEALWPSVREGGAYIIEDVQTSYWPHMAGAPLYRQSAATCAGWFAELTHYLNADESPEPGDPFLTELASSIGSLTFRHNLIIARKDSPPRKSAELKGS